MRKCPICQSSNTRFVLKIDKIWRKKYKVLYCNKCALYFLKDKPRLEEIIRYYQQEYYGYGFIKQIFKDFFRYFRSVSQFDYINKIIDVKNFSILEIGACDGVLLSMFRKHNKVLGTEFNLKYKAIAGKKFKVKLVNKDYSKLSQKFDLIIMSHVFEHFLDIDKAIRDLILILKPSGYLFIEFPNSPKFTGKVDAQLDEFLQTTHIYNFSTENILPVFKKHHLKIIDKSRYFYNLPNYYSAQTKRKIITTIAKGVEINIQNLFAIFIYFLNGVLNPANTYKKINFHSTWYGLGDNLRLIIQKNNTL